MPSHAYTYLLHIILYVYMWPFDIFTLLLYHISQISLLYLYFSAFPYEYVSHTCIFSRIISFHMLSHSRYYRQSAKQNWNFRVYLLTKTKSDQYNGQIKFFICACFLARTRNSMTKIFIDKKIFMTKKLILGVPKLRE